MSEPIDDGGPAFPVMVNRIDQHGGSEIRIDYFGMSLRDYLAAKEQLGEWDDPNASVSEPLATALAGTPKPKKGWSAETPEEYIEMLRWEAKWRAALKYIRADAMLEARKVKRE